MVGGGGPTDSGERENGGPVDAERQSLEDELLEAESALSGEVQQIECLARDNQQKVEELRDLEEDVKTLQERNEHDVSMLQDEHTSAQQELAHRLSVLQEQLARLNLKHDRYRGAASLSENAGAEIEAILAKMQRRTKTHAEEVHTTRQEVLYLRKGLEATFRKTLKDLEGTYRRKAFNDLGSEAKAGMRANKVLRDEMALQDVGVAALYERHVKQHRVAGELTVEWKNLKTSEEMHNSILADLQREARTNASYISDIQETKARISAAEKSLRNDLMKDGVPPNCILAGIRAMSEKEREEGRRLDNLKRQWQRRVKDITRAILPSTSKAQPAPSTASGMGQSTKTDISSSMDCTATTTSSEESSIAGFDGPKVLNSASSGDILRCNANPKKEQPWQGRVQRVMDGWPSDFDQTRHLGDATGAMRPTIATAGEVTSGEIQTQDGVPTWLGKGTPKAKRSASLPILDAPPSSPARQQQQQQLQAKTRTLVPQDAKSLLVASKSAGNFWEVSDEDPWKRKRRMERALRRRDAEMRARGVPVNSGRAGNKRRVGSEQ